jgi:hypothetical protein
MKKLLLFVTLVLIIPCLILARIVPVGLNDDLHFDYLDKQANDFHIEGLIHSSGGITPLVKDIHVFGDIGTGTWMVKGYSVQRIGMSDDWTFKLDFITDGYITYCKWIHFGIMFDVEAANIIFDLVGWWTLDGTPLTPLSAPVSIGKTQEDPSEYLQVAVTGFNVSNGILTIQNGTEMPVEIKSYELAVSDFYVPLREMFITGLGRPGEPSPMYPMLMWEDAIMEPIVLAPQEEYLIDLASLGIYLHEGLFLQMRGEQIMLGSKSEILLTPGIKKTKTQNDWGWFWEQHGE